MPASICWVPTVAGTTTSSMTRRRLPPYSARLARPRRPFPASACARRGVSPHQHACRGVGVGRDLSNSRWRNGRCSGSESFCSSSRRWSVLSPGRAASSSPESALRSSSGPACGRSAATCDSSAGNRAPAERRTGRFGGRAPAAAKRSERPHNAAQGIDLSVPLFYRRARQRLPIGRPFFLRI